MIKRDEKLTEYVRSIEEKHTDLLFDVCNATCTTGYDNDGSTGYEIFENGYDLGRCCELVFVAFSVDHIAWFFEGDRDQDEDQNADSVIKWLKDAVAEREAEE